MERGQLGRAAVRRLDQFARAVDLAQLPHRCGEPGHRRQAGVLAEAFARLPIALRVAGRERALAMGPRLREFPEIEADHGKPSASDAGFHKAPRILRFPQERRGHLPRRLEFAAHSAKVH